MAIFSYPLHINIDEEKLQSVADQAVDQWRVNYSEQIIKQTVNLARSFVDLNLKNLIAAEVKKIVNDAMLQVISRKNLKEMAYTEVENAIKIAAKNAAENSVSKINDAN